MSADDTLHRFFFFNDTATTEIYPLSLHDALPISQTACRVRMLAEERGMQAAGRDVSHEARTALGFLYQEVGPRAYALDRKSTRLNSSHSQISYAVFCLKKKKVV